MTQLPPPCPKKPRKSPSGLMDDYDWLRADNWQQVMKDPQTLAPEIREILEAENTHTTATMADTADIQQTLFTEMRGRILENDSSLPVPDGDWAYYSRYDTGEQYPLFCRVPKIYQDTVGNSNTPSPHEQIILNCPKMAQGYDFFQVKGCQHSYNHNLLIRAVDTNGSEVAEIRIHDLTTGNDLPDVIPNATGDVLWVKGDKQFLYSVYDDNHRPYRIYAHTLGDDVANDTLIYQENDPAFFLSMGISDDEQYIFITPNGHSASECWYLPAHDVTVAPKCIQPRADDVEYSVSHHNGTFYIVTNRNGATDFEIVATPVEKCGAEHWQPFIPHQLGCLVLGVEFYQNYMIRLERTNALPRIVIRHMNSGDEHTITFDEDAYSLGLSASLEYEQDCMRFSYASPTTPTQVFDYNMTTRQRTLRKTQVIPSGHNSADYRVKRHRITAPDGAEIPVTVLYHKNTPLDGTAPCLLYGYGSYGISMTAGFSTGKLSLVDRGFIWATAHIRGGMDCGFNWYDDGRKLNKKNTFTDFITVAEGLVKHGYTATGNISAMGGSAGGMLMGAVANMRPDLWKSILALVPFVDCLNTICDDTLPLTPPEWVEWGNPNTDTAVYDYMQSYSPYDNVTAQNYPHMWVEAGLTDPRVTYWEPAKWVAKLREHKTDTNMLLLKTNMGAGHGGASGRWDSLKETAEEYTFILKAHNII